VPQRRRYATRDDDVDPDALVKITVDEPEP
jgi:hypothetical protein